MKGFVCLIDYYGGHKITQDEVIKGIVSKADALLNDLQNSLYKQEGEAR